MFTATESSEVVRQQVKQAAEIEKLVKAIHVAISKVESVVGYGNEEIECTVTYLRSNLNRLLTVSRVGVEKGFVAIREVGERERIGRQRQRAAKRSVLSAK